MPAPKYTTPSASTGPPRIGQNEISRPLPRCHRSGRSAGAPRTVHTTDPVAALRQYTRPSSDPTYTRSLHATGANRTGPRVKNVHLRFPVSVSNALTLPSLGEPMNIDLPMTTGS